MSEGINADSAGGEKVYSSCAMCVFSKGWNWCVQEGYCTMYWQED